MKIIADSQIPLVAEAFAGLAEVSLYSGRQITAGLLEETDALLVRSVTTVNRDLLEGTPVRFVGTATSGLEHVDIGYLDTAGIGFASAHGCNAQSVVEYVLSSLFVLSSQSNFRLRDKTVGIIGCGEVGSRLHRALEIIGVNCLLNDPPLAEKTGDERYLDLGDLQQADVITLHVPWQSGGRYPTVGLIDEDFLSNIKQDALLVNTSRGGVISESDLKQHMARNPECLTVVDVWEHEPDIDRALLAHCDIGTPHIAGYSTDGKVRATGMIYQRLCEYFSIQPSWRPQFNYQDAGLHHININRDVSDEDALTIAVLSHYDVRSDAAALRRVLELDAVKQPDYFDELRRNYPVRREFDSTTIDLGEPRPRLAQQLRELGFRVAG